MSTAPKTHTAEQIQLTHELCVHHSTVLELLCATIKCELVTKLFKQSPAEIDDYLKTGKELFKHEVALRSIAELVNKKIRAAEDGLPRQYIVCPFEEKDQAKELGARWDSNKRKWYALDDETYDKLKKWHPSKPPTPVSVADEGGEEEPAPPAVKKLRASAEEGAPSVSA